MKAVLYARYSTENQSADSIEDQFRVCDRLAERHGLTVVERFSDAAISGGTTERPGYQAMLASARAKGFKVILAEDTSRLWRSLPEQWRAVSELMDGGVHIVTQDIDTRSENFKHSPVRSRCDGGRVPRSDRLPHAPRPRGPRAAR